jgi:hypothetical protein
VITAVSTLVLNGSTITSTSSGLTVTVDTVLPTVTAFSSSTADGPYGVGGAISITATTSEAVQSGNSITVTLETGTVDRAVVLTAASAGTSLTGTYTVQSGDVSADLTAASFAFTANAVRDTAGNAMTSTALPASTSNIAQASMLVVDGVLPTVTAFSSSTANGTFGIGGTITISATTSEAIRSGNSITVTLETGTLDRTVVLTAASAGTSLTGTYTVQSGDVSTDLTAASFTFVAGAVRDTAGNAMASTTMPALASNIAQNSALVVDGVVPTMTISPPL